MIGGLFVAAVTLRLAALAILGLNPETFEYEEQGISVAQSLFYVDVRHRWGLESLGVFLAATVGWRPRSAANGGGGALDGSAGTA